jgi:hypothetical protein
MNRPVISMNVSPVVVIVRSLMLQRWLRKLAGKGLMFLLSLTSLNVLQFQPIIPIGEFRSKM